MLCFSVANETHDTLFPQVLLDTEGIDAYDQVLLAYVLVFVKLSCFLLLIA